MVSCIYIKKNKISENYKLSVETKKGLEYNATWLSDIIEWEEIEMKKRKRNKAIIFLKSLGTFLVILLITIATLLAFSVKWMFKTWTSLTMDELVYHLMTPLDGTNTDMIKAYCNQCVVPTILVLALAVMLVLVNRKKEKIFRRIIVLLSVAAIGIATATIGITWNILDIGAYLKGQKTYSTFIDDNYVDPASVNITFPKQKRNLIYIFLESMEMTYTDQENGGAFKKNVIPELTKLAQDNEDFSGKDKKLNGGYSMPGTTWTMGAMFGQTSGLPLNISIDGNGMDTQDSFFPGITTIGDILQKEGYSQTLLLGSDATFGGRRLYFTDHGQYDILDYNYALENGLIPEDYKVWWGYEDEKLFAFAKDRLQELSQQDSPFNLTMLTVDTHFEDGYECDLCPDTFGKNQYANVMACSSKQVKEFIDWVGKQEFADNTTIVISGDHPTMDSDFCENVDSSYERRVYTTYINPAAKKETNKKREYTTFDNFPTTIAALGAEIEGDRLGLGTNLFSKTKTLNEKYGRGKEERALKQQSKLLKKMAHIDKNKQELLAREGKVPTAEIKTGKYKKQEGILPLKVEKIKYIQNGIQSITAAVWKNEDQSDLQWIPLAVQKNGNCTTKIDMDIWNREEGDYNIHIYIVDGNGDQYNIAQKVVEIK